MRQIHSGIGPISSRKSHCGRTISLRPEAQGHCSTASYWPWAPWLIAMVQAVLIGDRLVRHRGIGSHWLSRTNKRKYRLDYSGLGNPHIPDSYEPMKGCLLIVRQAGLS